MGAQGAIDARLERTTLTGVLYRRLLLTLPAMATLLVIVVLLGPGQPRTVSAVRALGVSEPDRTVGSLRLVAIRRDGAREEPLAGRELTVFVDDERSWSGSTDATGTAEVTFSPALPPSARVRVVDRAGSPLLDGTLSAEAVAPEGPSLGWLPGRSTGELTVAARVVRGPVVPPFPTRVRFFAGKDLFDGATFQPSQELPGKVDVTVRGGEPAKAVVVVGPDEPSELEITPIFEPLEIEVDFRSEDGRTGKLASTAPIVMSGFGVDDGHELVIASQAPRPFAFASFYDGSARVGGAVVPLTEAPDGFFKGRVERPGRTTAVVIASDPSERGRSTVTWPLGGTVGIPARPQLVELAEGFTMTTDVERQRLRRVRAATVAMLALAAFAEIALLLVVGRARRLAGEREPIQGNAEAPEGDSAAPIGPIRIAKNAGTTLLLAAVTALLLLLAFASIAGVAVLRD